MTFLTLSEQRQRSEFETEIARVRAVFAAVPEKENSKKIEKYILAEKEIYFKGGAL